MSKLSNPYHRFLLNHWHSHFFLFFLFNLCFFSLQLVFIYTLNGSFISAVKLPMLIWVELLATLIIHLFIYLLLSAIQTFLLTGILNRSWHYFSEHQWVVFIWSLTICAILSANSYYFPLSSFSELFSAPISESIIKIIMLISVLALGLLFINSLLYKKQLYLFLTLIIFATLFIAWNHSKEQIPNLKHQNPNVIILGIDSLSPESINEKNMPFFSRLLSGSIQFTNSISPLARTYPAWSSILTGLYTEHHHAEENLVSKSIVKSQASIAWILQHYGYTTLYATDDRRFNSIDTDFGFKKIIGPKMGVNDILLGTFNDYPLTNLIINYRISSWLFPYNYSNRASFFSYYPQTFNQKLKNDLALEIHKNPFFLAVHFTLPHWPYAWAESSPEQLDNEFSLEKRDVLYQQALRRVDKQFQAFFNYLEQNDYLKNSLLILLSDHGEALYYPGSRLTNYHNYMGKFPSRFAEYLKSKTATVLNKSAGHGSDILSPKQYHNVLAFRIYKNGQLLTQNFKINTRVALIDLAPTILDFLHLNNQQEMDGISLLPSILNSQHKLPERTFFIESGIFPNQILSKEKSLEIGREFYRVNPNTGNLEIKPNKLRDFNEQKLYGIIKDNWVLALYPDEKTYIGIIQNLSTGGWVDDLNSQFAKTTPVDQMYQQLVKFYGGKIFLPLSKSVRRKQ